MPTGGDVGAVVFLGGWLPATATEDEEEEAAAAAMADEATFK